MSRARNAGAALLVAVMLVALAAAAAASMLAQQHLDVRLVESLAARAQADAAAQAGVDLALQRLAVPQAAPAAEALSLGAADVRIAYADPQAFFNLNNLVRGNDASEADVRLFGEMLAAARLPAELASAVLDAIDADSETRVPGGAEDLDYLAMDPPRRAANGPLADPAHLARLRGFTPGAVARLRPWLTALPEATALNVNSAPPELLAAALPGLDLDAARRLVAARARDPFKTLADFRARLPENVAPMPGLAMDVASRYVLVESRARAGPSETAYTALVGLKGAAREGLIWRRRSED